MHGSKLHIVASAFGVTLALAATAPRARACSTVLDCSAPVRLFANNMLVPGNLVYFKVLVDDPGDLVLRVVDGEAIDASIRMMGNDRVFAPIATIASDLRVELEYTTACPPDSQLSPTTTVFQFSTGPAGELGTAPAVLSIGEQGVIMPGTGQFYVFSRLWYQPPGHESVIGRHLMDHVLTIDGAPATFSTGSTRGYLWNAFLDYQIPKFEFVTECAPEAQQNLRDSCGVTYRFTSGKHHVEARTTFVGATLQPAAVTLDVDLHCDEPLCSVPDGTPSSKSASDIALLTAADPGTSPTASGSADAMVGDREAAASATEAAYDSHTANATVDATALQVDPAGMPRTAPGCSVGAATTRDANVAHIFVACALAYVLRARRRSRQMPPDF